MKIFGKLAKNLGLIFCATLLITAGTACSNTEKTEAITADITAAQMEGRRAAGKILATNYGDTIALQKALLEARAEQSKYTINGHPECSEAYDSAFISTIRAVEPSLAAKIQPQKPTE